MNSSKRNRAIMTQTKTGKWLDCTVASNHARTFGFRDILAREILQTHEGHEGQLRHFVMSASDDVFQSGQVEAAPQRLQAYYPIRETEFLPPYLKGHPLETLVGENSPFGPNEARILSAVLGLECLPMFLIGGIGVGKSTVCRQLLHDWIPECRRTLKLPGPFLDFGFDFNEFNEKTAAEQIVESFTAEVNITIASFLKQAPEVAGPELSLDTFLFGWVLDDLASAAVRQHHIAPFLQDIFMHERARLRFSNPEEPDPGSVLAARRTLWDNFLRRALPDAASMARLQLAAAATRAAVRRQFAPDAAPFRLRLYGLFVLDNVDRLGAPTRRTVLDQMRAFASQAGVPTIIPARQSTFAVDTDNAYASRELTIIYRGPIPRRIVAARLQVHREQLATALQRARADSGEAVETTISVGELEATFRGLQELSVFLSSRRQVGEFLSSLCGNSVRKAIVLARRLIANSVYPQDKGGDLSVREMRRALLLGAKPTFHWELDDEVENVFGGGGSHPARSPLLKLRILMGLRPLYQGEPRLTATLVERLRRFGYDDDAIIACLNEMKRRHKRLIWSDAFRYDFHASDTGVMVFTGASGVHMTSIGLGYFDHLSGQIDYIQEMIPDTFGPRGGCKETYPDTPDGRVRMVVDFLEDLVARDEQEIAHYSRATPSHIPPGTDYEHVFGRVASPLLTTVGGVAKALEGMQHLTEHLGLQDRCEKLARRLDFAYSALGLRR